MRQGKSQITDILEEIAETPPESGRNPLALAPLCIRLAQALLAASHEEESATEEAARSSLLQLLSNQENQIFSLALTDRIHRCWRPETSTESFRALRARLDPRKGLGLWDRCLLWGGTQFGPFVPDILNIALRTRVESEVAPFLIKAAPSALSQEIELRKKHVGAINLNYLGEEIVSDSDARERIETYRTLAARTDVEALSIKLSGIDARLNPISVEDNVARLFDAVNTIAGATLGQRKCPILYFDMEAHRDLQMAEQLVAQLMSVDPEAQGWSPQLQFGLAVQTYLPEALGIIERLAELSARRVRRKLRPLRIRLVKGANLQLERVEASLRGLSTPSFASKLETDAHFKRCLRRLIEHAQSGALEVGVASHNLFDLSYALLLRAQSGVEAHVQLEMLEGMAGALGRTLAQTTGPILVYAPAVPEQHFTSAISYLVRRLDENTEPEHFLRDAAGMEVDDAGFERQQRAFTTSLEESWITPPETFRKQDRHRPTRTGRFSRRHEFYNASDTDWTRPENRLWLKECAEMAEPLLDSMPPGFGLQNPSAGFDPNRPQFRYQLNLASPVELDSAIEKAASFASSWSRTSRIERVSILRRVASRLEERRGDLICAMALDAGKRAFEADIEVSEAVDFARYYAHLAEDAPPVGAALGVIVVTPPWNFPLAIPLGGVLAALVTGNTVLLKPAPETPWVAQLAVECCYEAGVPREALHYLPCADQDASPLIKDPRVAAVILTGATQTAQTFLALRPRLKLLAETGGKNAAYLSAHADREQSIVHIVQSAFGHAGQKCSALSLLIVEKDSFFDDEFKHQLVEATKTLVVGSAWDPASTVTPLIHPPSGALKRILDRGHEYGHWALRPQIYDNPRLLSPGILWGVDAGSFPHQTEFFGPILAVMCAENFDHAMQLMNDTPYGLTAGLFSLLESEQEAFVECANAGNLYINRTLTGAVVGRQPFGGRKASGFGPGAKAGGPDYLTQLVQAPPLIDVKAAFKNYQKAMSDHFGRVHRGTEVVGEDNYLRYQTARTLVVLGSGVSTSELAASLLARQLSKNTFPIFSVTNDPPATFEARLHSASCLARISDGVVEIAAAHEVIDYCRKHAVERIRLVGRIGQDFYEEAARLPLSVLDLPVSSEGRAELMHYLMSQSISHSYHRFGNLKLRQISRLEQTLCESADRLRS